MNASFEFRNAWLVPTIVVIGCVAFVATGLFLDRNHPSSIERGFLASIFAGILVFAWCFALIGLTLAVFRWLLRLGIVAPWTGGMRAVWLSYIAAIALPFLPWQTLPSSATALMLGIVLLTLLAIDFSTSRALSD